MAKATIEEQIKALEEKKFQRDTAEALKRASIAAKGGLYVEAARLAGDALKGLAKKNGGGDE